MEQPPVMEPKEKVIPKSTENLTSEEIGKQIEKDTVIENKEEKDKLKERALLDKIAFSFKSKQEKETFTKQENFANEYIDKGVVKTKGEKEFLLSQSANLVRFVNSGKITMPTDEEMINLLRDAGVDKFKGIVSYKDGKIQYRKSKDVNWAGSSTSAVS